MNPLRKLLLLPLALAVVLAGCATDDPLGDDDGTVAPPASVSRDEAARMLAEAASNMPDTYGFRFTVSTAGKEFLTMEGAVDNATGTSYIEATGDPQVLAGAEGGGSGDAEAAAFLAQGFSIYSSEEDGALYLVNGTAYVFPPEAGEGEQGGFVPSPEDSPFGAFLQPSDELRDFAEGVNVTSVRPLVHRGQAAVEVVFTHADDDGNQEEATAILFVDPVRLAHVESTVEDEEAAEGSPFRRATASGDFYYGDEVTVKVPPAASRALGLAYDSDANPFFGGDGPVTWTFRNSAGVALDEVAVEVKGEPENASEEGMPDVASMPTLWSMTLSEGTKSEGGVTLTFTDADADGTVSAGDTLRIEAGEDAEGAPTVVLKDLETGTYVVPGFGAVLALAAAAGLALLVGRRR